MSPKYNIYLRKDGRYEGRIPVGRKADGKIRYRSIYHRDVKKLKLLMDAERKAEPLSVSSSKMRFSGLFDLWYNAKADKVRESTLAIYRCHLDVHLRPLLGRMYLSAMTTEKLNDCCREALFLRKDGKGELSAKSKTDILRTLNNILKFGMNKGYISRHIQAEYPKAETKQMNVLREKEQKALESVLRAHLDQREALGVYLCLYTGLRVGELCGLRWDDLDFDQEMIYVRRTVQRICVQGEERKTAVVMGEPKSAKSKRDIPIPDHLLTVLRDLKNGQTGNFFLSDTGKCHEPRRMQAAFHRYLDEAGLSRRGIHCTRHTFATRWVELGVDIKTLSEILGHTSIRITLDKYVHISEKVKRESINKIQPLFAFDIGQMSRQSLTEIPPYTGDMEQDFVYEQT
ncbi:MAG: tyrosine-type recombinase/integrase [Eubacteriales bacterium]